MRYWEDFEVGETERYGAYAVTEAEIIEFAKAYDPLPFHTDPQAAKDSPYGALTAPGLLTCSIFMRLLVDHVLLDAASMGSPGVDQVRWLKPVYAGDTLSVRQQTLSTRVLESRPEMGLVKNRFEVLNQHDEVVCDIASNGLFARRDATGAPA
ncbi:MaoC family dehydratase [Salinisphaera sp.]|uniref:MaoC family dehydratase n=1 Tax=Salinisphaera sp. TaxID=1914330 RepID=UPI000C5A1BD8|nr:MaoC family dehydratase [Salinisphaera sp.]MBS62195.1 dehydratase [Salinisphaera sp.]